MPGSGTTTWPSCASVSSLAGALTRGGPPVESSDGMDAPCWPSPAGWTLARSARCGVRRSARREQARGGRLVLDLTRAWRSATSAGATFAGCRPSTAHGEAAGARRQRPARMSALLRARPRRRPRRASPRAVRPCRMDTGGPRARAALGLSPPAIGFIGEAAVGGGPAARAGIAHAAVAGPAPLCRPGRRALVAAGGVARLPDRADPGLPVGGADAALRRRSLRRQPGRDQPDARTRAAAVGGDPGGPHRICLRRRDRHHEGERGGRRAEHHGARPDDHAGAAAADRGDAGDAGA